MWLVGDLCTKFFFVQERCPETFSKLLALSEQFYEFPPSLLKDITHRSAAFVSDTWTEDIEEDVEESSKVEPPPRWRHVSNKQDPTDKRPVH